MTHVCKENEVILSDTTIINWSYSDSITQLHPSPINIEFVVGEKPEPKYITIYEPVKVPVDTMAILADWLKIRTYDTTLVNDTSIYIRLREQVFRNEIYNRKLWYEVRGQDKIITNTIYRNGFYGGGSLSLQGNFYMNIGLQSQKNIYIFGLSPINQDLNFTFMRHF